MKESSNIFDWLLAELLTVVLQRFARDVQVGGAKRVSDESPPPPEVILPVIQTPEVMQLTGKGEKTGTPVRNQKKKKSCWKAKIKK